MPAIFNSTWLRSLAGQIGNSNKSCASITLLTDSIITLDSFNPFRANSQVLFSQNTNWKENCDTTKIIYSPSTGTFKARKKSTYSIHFLLFILGAVATAPRFTMKIKKNNFTIWTTDTRIENNGAGSTGRSGFILVDLKRNDIITCQVSDANFAVGATAGTTFSMHNL